MRSVIEGRVQMRKVKVNKEELLKEIRQNREKHIAEYKDAVADYKTLAMSAVRDAMGHLERRISELKEGEVVKLQAVSFNLAVPQNHSKDYDQVIKMLQMSIDNELEIQSDEFACYVMDDWGWKEQFLDTYHSNKTMAMTTNR